jgi:hypothetical protein
LVKNSPERRYLDRKIGLVDDCLRPYGSQNLVLRDKIPAVLYQDHKHFEGAGADIDRHWRGAIEALEQAAAAIQAKPIEHENL